HTAEEASLFDGVLQGDGVDDGREHTHMVRGNTVHVDGLFGDAAKEVAATDDANLAPGGRDFGNFHGNFVDEDGIDAETPARGQCFSGKLEEDTLVHAWLSVQGECGPGLQKQSRNGQVI